MRVGRVLPVHGRRRRIPKGLDVTKAYTLRFVNQRVGMDMKQFDAARDMLDSVGRRFGRGGGAARHFAATIAAGDFVGLLGPSGCGKSTLLRLIAGLDQPDAGRLIWDAGRQPMPGEIGFVFQDATLLPWATAADNVYLPLRLRGMARAQATPLVASVAGARWPGRICEAAPAAAFRRHAHARLDCARPGDAPTTAADGRTVRGTRRIHPPQAAGGPAAACGRNSAARSSS